MFARYQTPQDIANRWVMKDTHVPVTIGDVRIQAGDFVLGDGVVIIPQSTAEEVIAKAETVVHTENAVRKAIIEGVHPLEAYEKFGRF